MPALSAAKRQYICTFKVIVSCLLTFEASSCFLITSHRSMPLVCLISMILSPRSFLIISLRLLCTWRKIERLGDFRQFQSSSKSNKCRGHKVLILPTSWSDWEIWKWLRFQSVQRTKNKLTGSNKKTVALKGRRISRGEFYLLQFRMLFDNCVVRYLMMFMALAAAINKNTTDNNGKEQKENWNSPILIMNALRVDTNYEFLSGVLITYVCIKPAKRTMSILICWHRVQTHLVVNKDSSQTMQE